MKDYIEAKTEALVQGNKAERMLLRKNEIVQVAESKLPNGETVTEIVICAAGNTWTKITVLDSYDEIKAALASQANVEGVKKIIDDLVNEVAVGPNAIGLDGHWLLVNDGWAAMDSLRNFAKQLKERLDSGLNNED